jgi:DNA helicase II / ATP-dependent DNA helicase PcrA
MEFELNEERSAYLSARGQIVLNACPGSGKTTCLVKKLISLQGEYGTYYGTACLSFTNTAKDEINRKYAKYTGRQIGFPNHVSTIDSFINQYITLPFFHLLNEDYGRPVIVDEDDILDRGWQHTYIDKKDGKEKPALNSSLKPFVNKAGQNLFRSYPPSSLRIEVDGSFSFNGKHPSVNNVDLEVFNNYCKHIKGNQFRKGILNSYDSEFIALRLLRKFPSIAKWLALRFPHVIIDEAQDTSEIQYAIIEILIQGGLKNIELIGDPYQSLYEWRNAKPQMFLERYQGGVWTPLDLTNNRRSPQRIVDAFSLIRKVGDRAIVSNCPDDLGIPLTVYRYNSDTAKYVLRHFETTCEHKGFSDSQIVVRAIEFKDELLGKGSDRKPWTNSIPYEIISAQLAYFDGNVKEAVGLGRKAIAKLQYPTASYTELREIRDSLANSPMFNSLVLDILHALPSVDSTIADWTATAEALVNEKLSLNPAASFELRARGSSVFKKENLSEPVIQHFKPSSSAKKIPISTIHNVKGRSLDSILVFFSETGGITFGMMQNNYQGFPGELRRIAYVALSRPMHLLAMAFPDSVTNAQITAKFGNDVKIISDTELGVVV